VRLTGASMDVQVKRLLDSLSLTGRPAPADIPAFLLQLPDVGAFAITVGDVDPDWADPPSQAAILGPGHSPNTSERRLGSARGAGRAGASRWSAAEWQRAGNAGVGVLLPRPGLLPDPQSHRAKTSTWISGTTRPSTSTCFSTQGTSNRFGTPIRPSKRLLGLHRSVRPIRIAVTRLLVAGALAPMSGRDSHPPRIADDVLACGDAIDEFCLGWADPEKRVWLAGIIGDWPAAHEAAAGQHEIQRITGPRAEECRAIRWERLLQESGNGVSDALYGLANWAGQMTRSKRRSAVHRAVLSRQPSNSPSSKTTRNWCPHIYSMFKRMKPTGQLPEPHIWMTSLKFLLRHGYQKDEMIACLVKTGGTEIGESVMLALEHAPQHALPLIRRGLLADIPCNRTTVAAVLAVIAKPWCMRELLRALEVSDDQEKTADARAAILETGDQEAEKVVLAWEEKNPHEDELGNYLEINGRKLGPFYSMAEHMLKRRASWVRYEMDKLHDRVMTFKNIVPPEPSKSKSRWKFWSG